MNAGPFLAQFRKLATFGFELRAPVCDRSGFTIPTPRACRDFAHQGKVVG
jgi:hypothetical protein